ncbi:Flp family type IVb pilin [Cohaesibacter celericrescens]|uniref:Flp family type IVb pilin n=1 Tax=Cohaesibacter celericrescens TaxID=2067669 RepID=A0A2N5XMV9_9HYPH|nr:Flp family type IVb pilin [Cohaesibacter celericrescens]PLW75833.1 Flp family type IVb pilin [Cohaesibacter celericrescens]
MKNFVLFMNDESGATAIEYALLAGLIGVGIVSAASALKGNITSLFAEIGVELDKAIP